MHRECALDHSKEPASLVKITRLVTGLAWGPGHKRVVAFKGEAAITLPALPSILGRSEWTYGTEALCMGSWGLPTCVFASMQGCHVPETTTHPMALWSAVGSKPTTLGTCVPQADALTNWAPSYSHNYLLPLLWGPVQSKYKAWAGGRGVCLWFASLQQSCIQHPFLIQGICTVHYPLAKPHAYAWTALDWPVSACYWIIGYSLAGQTTGSKIHLVVEWSNDLQLNWSLWL